MQKTLIVLSLILLGLSGCYMRSHGHHDERAYIKAHHDSRNNGYNNDRGAEHCDR